MDDAICLSDDDGDECILIEETTVVTTRKSQEKTCSTSYSLVDSVNNRPRSNPITSKDWLEEGLDELDKLIQEKRKNNGNSASWSIGNGNIGDIDMMDYGRIPSTSSSSGYATSSGNIGNKPEKRKLTEDEKDNQREMKENAKRAREAEKEKKAIEKDQKKGEMLKKREEKEREKETRKIEREISAAINSKCEQYTYCHIGKTVMNNFPGLEAEIRILYAERKIDNQLKIENDLGTRIEWRRKCIEMKEDEDGRNERFEYMSTQNLFAIVVPAATLKDVINSNSFEDFIIEQRAGFQNGRCTMLIISFGKLDIQKKRLHKMSLEIYETHRVQIVQIETIHELALLTAQYLRSLARREKKKMDDKEPGESSGGSHKLQYLGEKGIVIGSRNEIVSDWWSKMLSTIDRLSDAQRRAILGLIPDPISGIDKYSKMDYSLAIQEIGDLVAENGRKVGPVMAHRVLTMLTDETGNSIVE
ncbi:hypothetical protein GCK72_001425 [Caenorhabditis remanei]|uniref:ERCC4 domain-containing protein n=1 Tax=Caenorhabditis remanei TaxID=31234 RepID=A0A6A5HNX3_CAERE|nr:hypothetical protein GCK72_001425 [Caenorhabditis remanei]KAF1769608.1 hypothetical protein GCK72_001425 [Caenorhabditis remanei]